VVVSLIFFKLLQRGQVEQGELGVFAVGLAVRGTFYGIGWQLEVAAFNSFIWKHFEGEGVDVSRLLYKVVDGVVFRK